MKISIIVAASLNGVIGAKNKLPWYLPADLRHFKAKTLGHHILMGRTTFDSIGRVLPNRVSIVVSRTMDDAVSGYRVVRDIASGLAMAKEAGETELFVIGGGEIYAQVLPLADLVYLTRIHAHLDGEVFFPALGQAWEVIDQVFCHADEKNQYDYTFMVFEKKQKEETRRYENACMDYKQDA